jgi:hypothetical protein
MVKDLNNTWGGNPAPRVRWKLPFCRAQHRLDAPPRPKVARQISRPEFGRAEFYRSAFIFGLPSGKIELGVAKPGEFNKMWRGQELLTPPGITDVGYSPPLDHHASPSTCLCPSESARGNTDARRYRLGASARPASAAVRGAAPAWVLRMRGISSDGRERRYRATSRVGGSGHDRRDRGPGAGDRE